MAAKQLYVDIDALTDKYNAKIDAAFNKLEGFGEKAKQLGTGLTLAVSIPLTMMAFSSVKAAASVEESINKVNVVFKESGDKVKKFAETSLTSFGISKGAALDMSSSLGKMAIDMGVNTKVAAEMGTNLVAFASTLNIPIEQAMSAMEGVFKEGESGLGSLGIVMDESTLKAYALSKGVKAKYESMTEAQKVALRYSYVMDSAKTSTGDFANTSLNASAQMRLFGETTKEINASFGEVLLPYFTAAIQKVNGVMQAFNGLDKDVKKNILIGAAFAAAVGPTLVIMGSLISNIRLIASAFTLANLPAMAFAGALAASAYLVINNWEKVREFFYELELSFFKFKTSLGAGLFNLGLIDAKTAFGDLDQGFQKVSRWSKGGSADVGKMAADIKKQFSEIGSSISGAIGGNGTGKGTPLGKAIEDDTLQMNLLAHETKNTIARIKELDASIKRYSEQKITGEVNSIKPTTSRTNDQINAGSALMDSFKGSTLGDSIASGAAAAESAIAGLGSRIGGSLDMAYSDLAIKWADFGEKFGMSAEQAFGTVKQIAEIGIAGLADIMASGLGNVFNQDVEFDPKKMIGQVLKSIGQMLIGIATPLVAALALGNVATFGGMSANWGAALGMLGAGIAMSAGGQALSSSSSNSGVGSSGGGGSRGTTTYSPAFTQGNTTQKVEFAFQNGALKAQLDYDTLRRG